MTTVGVEYPGNTPRTWDATLLNVQYIDGRWKAAVRDNCDGLIYVVDAETISQWRGEL